MIFELDITDFFANAAPMDYSASVMEIGRNAGVDTWEAAVEDSERFSLLDTDEKRDVFRDHVKGFGAWDVATIAMWTDIELNALCIQMVAGDIRRSQLAPDSPIEAWERYYVLASEGSVNSRLTRGADGRVYYTLGS